MVSRYDAFDHIGYDATGAKLMRRKTGDRIDMTIGETILVLSVAQQNRTDSVRDLCLVKLSKYLQSNFYDLHCVNVLDTLRQPTEMILQRGEQCTTCTTTEKSFSQRET